MREARGLGHFDVDAHEQVERAQGAIDFRLIGPGDDGVAADAKQCANLPRAGREDFIGERCGRHFRAELGEPAHASLGKAIAP
jgi:hypothetical protein